MSGTEAKADEFPKLTVLVSPGELELRTWLRIIQFHDRMGRRMEQIFTRHGLTSAQFDVLATLHAGGEGITQQELAKRLLVTKGNVCGLIDRLETAGWVERRPDPEDRRANRLHLTDEGRRRLHETMPDHRALVREILGRIDAGPMQTLYDLLGQLDPGDPEA
jgi:MarR family transcriptional regulator, organic hydroperoxide resistance regulator